MDSFGIKIRSPWIKKNSKQHVPASRSESSRPLARVVIGGILCAMVFSLWVFPLIFGWAYRKFDKRPYDHQAGEGYLKKD